MRYSTRSASSTQKMPNTQVISLLDDRLLIFIRSWNGDEINQKISDEIGHYLSSVEADIELTNSFEYIETLTSIGNKMRVSLLLANENIYRSVNKDFYQNGAEVFVIYQYKSEMTWASVGRFKIEAQKQNKNIKLYDSGSRFDNEILLPVSLLGLNKNPEIQIGGISIRTLDEIQISSIFSDQETFWKVTLKDFSN